MTQLNRMPTYADPLLSKGQTTRTWYQFWSGLLNGQPSGPVRALTVGPSPYSYVAPVGGTVILSGGSTTQVKFSRDGANFYVTGQTAGMFPLSQGDTLVVNYSSSLPTANFVPR